MISLPDFVALQAALSLPLEPTLHCLLADRIADAIACECQHLTHIIVVEPDDREEDFLREAAFSPFTNPLSDSRHGEPGFAPPWDWAGRHDGWTELLTCIGNDGFALIILIPPHPDIDPRLLSLLQEHVPCG
jgi:hypothetical protein